MMKFNCRFYDINLLTPEVAMDLLAIPKDEEDEIFVVAWTYNGGDHKVRFQNCLDGKTIRWFVDGQEMPEFIFPEGTDPSFIANSLRSVCQSAQ